MMFFHRQLARGTIEINEIALILISGRFQNVYDMDQRFVRKDEQKKKIIAVNCFHKEKVHQNITSFDNNLLWQW